MRVWDAGCHEHAALSTLSGTHIGSTPPPPRGSSFPQKGRIMENQLRSILCSGREKNKGTKRDFSLVEDLRGVLLCLEGEIKAEGGLCTTGWHWEHSGTP